MRLSSQAVKHVANLARIRLGSSEVKKFRQELSSILEYVDQLDAVDVPEFQPISQISGLKNVKREDQTNRKECLDQQAALSNAPDREGVFFKVKAVL